MCVCVCYKSIFALPNRNSISNGPSYVPAKCRGEVLVGRLKSCSREGVQVSLDFFDDIYVPEHVLQDNSFFSEAEKLWVWKWEGECTIITYLLLASFDMSRFT